MKNKETYYLVLPATTSKYEFATIKRDNLDSVIKKPFAAIFEKNPLFVLQAVSNGSNLYVTDIVSGLEELSNINPLNEELFSFWINRFDYLCFIMESLGLQKHLAYAVTESNPIFGKLKSDAKVKLVKVPRKRVSK